MDAGLASRYYRSAKKRDLRTEMEGRRLSDKPDPRHTLYRSERRWHLQDGKFPETRPRSR